jgi:hypothetical protein
LALNFNFQTYQNDNSPVVSGVGLQFTQTGVPLFLLYSRAILKNQYHFLSGVHKFESFLSSLENKQDRKDFEKLHAFFESGGQKAFLILSPLCDKEMNLKSFIGQEAGYDTKSGLHLLSSHSHHGDILSVPQAAQYLDPEEYQFFSQKVLDVVEGIDHLFALLDTPFNIDLKSCKEIAAKTVGTDGAIFYPWFVKGKNLCPPSIVMAALIQQNDQNSNLSDSLANRPFHIPYLPVKIIKINEANDLLNSNINVIHLIGSNQIRVYRGVTLSKSSESLKKYISLRRISKSLEFSLGMICEKYVLEPLNQNTRVMVQNELEDFCQGLKDFFDPFSQKPFKIQTRIGEGMRDNTLIVDAYFKLPNALEELNLGIKMAN